MSAAWWPPGAPVAARRLSELTSRELRILTQFAESGPVGADTARLAEFLGSLRDEATERAELRARITVAAKTGKRTLL